MDETRNYINLVLTVKKYPALYDLSCNDYHNRVVRNKMWRAVAQEVNASGKNYSEFKCVFRVPYARFNRIYFVFLYVHPHSCRMQGEMEKSSG